MTALSLFDALGDEPEAPLPVVLRDYQRKAVAATLEARDRGLTRVLLVAATGTGKTSIFSKIIADLGVSGCRGALVIAHREELLQQSRSRIQSMAPGLRVGIERAHEKAEPGSDVVVAGVATIGRPGTKRLDWFRPGALVIDESHHAAADSYLEVMRRFGSFGGRCFTIGFTATPHRMDNKPLHGTETAIFEECIFTYGIMDAIRDGYLVDIRGYQVLSGVDISHVKKTAGDFNQKELAKAVDDEKRDAAALKHWFEVARDRSTMVFCASVEHAHHVKDLYRAHGITAEAVDGTTHPELRRQITERFQEGKVQVLCNMAVFTEGFDAPICSCILMLRPTQSWTVFVQAAGRGLRPYPGKPDCIVIDVVDNSGRHSLASVPAMIGLPGRINLQGHTLSEAKAKIDGAGARAASLGIVQDILEPGEQPRSIDFDQLDTMLSSVDMFASIRPPEEVAKVSTMMWLPMPGGAFMLTAGKRDHAQRVARLIPDTLGAYTLRWGEGAGTDRAEACGSSLEEALTRADSILSQCWPGVQLTGSTEAHWRREPPTDKQKAFLIRHKVPDDVLSRLDRGSASGLITQIMERGK